MLSFAAGSTFPFSEPIINYHHPQSAAALLSSTQLSDAGKINLAGLWTLETHSDFHFPDFFLVFQFMTQANTDRRPLKLTHLHLTQAHAFKTESAWDDYGHESFLETEMCENRRSAFKFISYLFLIASYDWSSFTKMTKISEFCCDKTRNIGCWSPSTTRPRRQFFSDKITKG